MKGKLDLDKTLGHYLPELENEHMTHARMNLRDILTHQSGLKAFVPFYTKLMKNGKLKKELVSETATETHGRARGRRPLHPTSTATAW